MIRLHYLQHVPFENAANIAVWAADRGHTMTRTLLYENAALPAPPAFDWLVIMGGPMSIYEEERYPWLKQEKALLRETLKAGIPALGVCLGAQLMADVLGGRVTNNEYREIGWYPVTLTAGAERSPLFEGFPATFTAFHWHGDVFSIPPGATHLARSDACANQAFLAGENALGLQFHLDYHLDSIAAMVENCGDELTEGPYTQTSREELCDAARVQDTKALIFRLLDACSRRFFPG